MPYYNSIIYSAAATTPSINLDPAITPFNATVVCTVLGGATVSYKLQWTLNLLDGPLETDSQANWLDSGDIPAGTTTSASTAFINPIGRIRLVIASLSGGTLQLQVRQGLSTN
jgi:hypothetical protein